MGGSGFALSEADNVSQNAFFLWQEFAACEVAMGFRARSWLRSWSIVMAETDDG